MPSQSNQQIDCTFLNSIAALAVLHDGFEAALRAASERVRAAGVESEALNLLRTAEGTQAVSTALRGAQRECADEHHYPIDEFEDRWVFASWPETYPWAAPTPIMDAQSTIWPRQFGSRAVMRDTVDQGADYDAYCAGDTASTLFVEDAMHILCAALTSATSAMECEHGGPSGEAKLRLWLTEHQHFGFGYRGPTRVHNVMGGCKITIGSTRVCASVVPLTELVHGANEMAYLAAQRATAHWSADKLRAWKLIPDKRVRWNTIGVATLGSLASAELLLEDWMYGMDGDVLCENPELAILGLALVIDTLAASGLLETTRSGSVIEASAETDAAALYRDDMLTACSVLHPDIPPSVVGTASSPATYLDAADKITAFMRDLRGEGPPKTHLVDRLMFSFGEWVDVLPSLARRAAPASSVRLTTVRGLRMENHG